MERLSDKTRELLKSSEHLFLKYQDDITTRMYEIMFAEYPDIKPMFESAREHQPKIFAAAVMCHLISLDDPEVLQGFRISICRRHVISGVQEQHYEMMANSLFKAMKEVLRDEANDETLNAWQKWFYYLANLLIEREREHYQGKHLLFPADADPQKHYYQDKFGIFTANNKEDKS